MSLPSFVSNSSGTDHSDQMKRKDSEDTSESSEKAVSPVILMPNHGRVRVAKYFPGKNQPIMKGFRNVLIHVSNQGLGGPLSPFQLKNEYGQLLENIWQFSKLYSRIGSQMTPISRFRPGEIIWEHPSEIHTDSEGDPTTEYWNWRSKGMNNQFAVRYPAGFWYRTKCICSIVTDDWIKDRSIDPSKRSESFHRLTYLEARKTIYCGEYARLCRSHPEFLKLKSMLCNGENLLILEVDGPPLDQNQCGFPYNLVGPTSPGLLLTETIIATLIDDARFPFGHGYTIGALLLGYDSLICASGAILSNK